MAQTTSAISGCASRVYVSTKPSDAVSKWTDISGTATGIEISGGENLTGFQMTYDGQASVLLSGNKNEPYTIEVTCLYTDVAAEAFRTVYTLFDGATKTLALLLAPNGRETGEYEFYTVTTAGTKARVPLLSCLPPSSQASNAEPQIFTFSVMTPRLLMEAIS